MSIEFACSGCQSILRVPDNSAGKKAKCPKCETIVVVPATSQPAEPSFDSTADTASSPFGNETPAAAASANPYSAPQVDSFKPQLTEVGTGEIQNQQVEVGSVIRYAWEAWQANLGVLVGAFCIVAVINIILSVVLGGTQAVLEENNAEIAAALVALFGNLASNVLGVYLSIGQAQIALKVARRQPAEVADLFRGGPRFWPVLGFSILAGIILTIGFLLCIVPGVILLLLYWPSYYLVVDNKSPVMESFTLARTITQGNVGTSFVLGMACFGINLLGLLACCIGIIFAGPLVGMIGAVAYLMMSGQLPAQATYWQGYGSTTSN